MRAATPQAERGFTVLELMIATAIFLVICGAMFGLLQLSQQKYSSETQLSGAFQETRLAIDQIVRDFNVSGYPSQSLFSTLPANSTKYAASAVAWKPGYPGIPCSIGAPVGTACTTPGDFDLILETDLGNGVSWIRYQLIGTTLYRAVVPKTAWVSPDAATSAAAAMVPFLTNVMNSPSAAQLTQITTDYPSMYPGGGPQPIFTYTCDTPAGPQPCAAAGNYGVVNNIRDVDITLIVMTRQRDLQTQQLKLVELDGRGHRTNPVN
ncbi:MAG TPA: type II secretion system protein [Candidatus Sulfotelmatobacter sp.]|jgi:prepilin-type N-terminal cleavage/methylation domain-containing protein|nr:type II secretion system protein [Candidatus Sulfotelmatobacter sp.]